MAAALREVKNLRQPAGRVRYLSAEEEHRLMEALANKPELRRLILGALLTGARASELFGLRREAVDLCAGEITFLKTKNRKVRRVPIATALAPVLKEALALSKTGLVFERPDGRQYARDTLRKVWTRVRTAAKLEDLHFHDLRHSFASSLRRRGVGLDTIQALLGHASITVTMRYAHLGADAQRAALLDLPAPGFSALTTHSCVAPSLVLIK